MHERFLESRGICYRINHFLPDRPTLLLIHGFSASSSGWRTFEERWQDRYNLIIPDLRGHGKSRRYPRFRDYAPHEYAQDLALLIDALDARETIVVGYSLGAELALNLYLLRKNAVRGAVLVSPLYKLSTLWRVRIGRPFIYIMSALSRLVPAGLAVPGYVDYSQFSDAGDESPTRIMEDISHTGPRAYFDSLLQIFNYPCDRRWADLRAPALLLWGAHDTVMPRSHLDGLRERIPRAAVRIIENGSHMLPYHNAPEVAEAVENFIVE